jgi:hypothetical protein
MFNFDIILREFSSRLRPRGAMADRQLHLRAEMLEIAYHPLSSGVRAVDRLSWQK